MFDSVLVLALSSISVSNLVTLGIILVMWFNLALNGQIASRNGRQGQYENGIIYEGAKINFLKCIASK